MSRGLSNEFMEELKNGQLSPLRDTVLHDQTLDLEIRDNYINVSDYFIVDGICLRSR